MDIKAKVDELVQKLKADDGLAKRFFREPIKTLEELLGVNLPDEQIKALIDGIKEKLTSEELGDKVEDFTDKVEDLAGKVAGKVSDKLGDLFGKK